MGLMKSKGQVRFKGEICVPKIIGIDLTLEEGLRSAYLSGVDLLEDSTVTKDQILRCLGITHATATNRLCI